LHPTRDEDENIAVGPRPRILWVAIGNWLSSPDSGLRDTASRKSINSDGQGGKLLGSPDTGFSTQPGSHFRSSQEAEDHQPACAEASVFPEITGLHRRSIAAQIRWTDCG
jgi:hypothetical protein